MQTAGPDFDLLLGTERDQIAGVDALCQRFAIIEHPVDAQHVRHQVVRENGQPVDVLEAPKTLAREGQMQIGRHDLGSLQEGNFDAVVGFDVLVVWHLHEQPHQLFRRSVGGENQVRKAAVVFFDQQQAQIVQGKRKMVHELAGDRVGGVLVEYPAAIGDRELRQLFGRQRPAGSEMVFEGAGNRKISGHAGAFFEMRVVARVEIDAVQGEKKRQGVLAAAKKMAAVVVNRPHGFGKRQLLHIGRDPVPVDSNPSGSFRNRAAGAPDPVRDTCRHGVTS